MVRRWLTRREEGLVVAVVDERVGAAATGLVMLVIAVTKFTHGAWIVVVLIPLLVACSWHPPPLRRRGRAALAGGLSRGRRRSSTPCWSWSATSTAASSRRCSTPTRSRPPRRRCMSSSTPTARGGSRSGGASGASGCRSSSSARPTGHCRAPLLEYVDHLLAGKRAPRGDDRHPGVHPARWWQHLLHNQTALVIKGALLFRKRVVVVDVPFHLKG